jgi:hypothetical protein
MWASPPLKISWLQVTTVAACLMAACGCRARTAEQGDLRAAPETRNTTTKPQKK